MLSRERRSVGTRSENRGKAIHRSVVIMQRQGQLFDVVAALHTSRSLASGLHCGQKQSNKDADDAMTTRSSTKVNPGLIDFIILRFST